MLEYLEKIIETQSIEELWDIHTAKMASYGFDRLIYGFTRFRTASSLGNREDFLVLTNHSEEYIDAFMRGGLYFDAPMVNWAIENVGACSWAWLRGEMGALTPKEQKVFEFNRKEGVTVGYSISFKEVSSRAKGAIGMCAQPGMTQDEADAVWAEHGRDIVMMNNVAHLKITNLPYVVERKSLTERQREVLEWVGDGKTTQDIATIMGLTPATVEKHLRLARLALDVDTTAQAVLKASYQNQIFVLNPDT